MYAREGLPEEGIYLVPVCSFIGFDGSSSPLLYEGGDSLDEARLRLAGELELGGILCAYDFGRPVGRLAGMHVPGWQGVVLVFLSSWLLFFCSRVKSSWLLV